MLRLADPRTEGFARRDGVDLHFQVFGDGDRAILLLPTWSIVQLRVSTPVRLTRLKVPFNPTTPQKAAGMRTEPPVSVPSAQWTRPAAVAIADPPLDPPGM